MRRPEVVTLSRSLLYHRQFGLTLTRKSTFPHQTTTFRPGDAGRRAIAQQLHSPLSSGIAPRSQSKPMRSVRAMQVGGQLRQQLHSPLSSGIAPTSPTQTTTFRPNPGSAGFQPAWPQCPTTTNAARMAALPGVSLRSNKGLRAHLPLFRIVFRYIRTIQCRTRCWFKFSPHRHAINQCGPRGMHSGFVLLPRSTATSATLHSSFKTSLVSGFRLSLGVTLRSAGRTKITITCISVKSARLIAVSPRQSAHSIETSLGCWIQHTTRQFGGWQFRGEFPI
jgi:hypothetical protein